MIQCHLSLRLASAANLQITLASSVVYHFFPGEIWLECFDVSTSLFHGKYSSLDFNNLCFSFRIIRVRKLRASSRGFGASAFLIRGRSWVGASGDIMFRLGKGVCSDDGSRIGRDSLWEFQVDVWLPSLFTKLAGRGRSLKGSSVCKRILRRQSITRARA